ncbi:MAG: DUF6048 family protein [Prevotella sp.]|nr:DUF6048 family protein [Prevotella sp.]MCM1074139.1 DUF6048 family protein [Ruminococcus sp.]
MIKYSLILYIVSLLCPLTALAQRQVTPVESDDKKPASPTLHYYDKHGNALDEPVLFLATLDTVASNKTNSRPVYPKLYAAEFGLNFADGILVLAGQHYGGADIWSSLSMWNWLFPTVELGLGGAKNTPDGLNYTYKSSPAFYAKIGADYNFLYKSNPDYKLLTGLRAGFSSFAWSLSDITIPDSYWGEDQHLSISGQKATAFYGELLAGLRVRLFKEWSLGWTFRYRFLFSCSDGKASRPWYVPGYGARDNHFGFTLSLSYTLPLSYRTAAPADNLVPE